MIFEQFPDVCTYILHSCLQRGESALLWIFGATWKPQSSLLCESLTSVKPTKETVSGVVGLLQPRKAQQQLES